MQFVDDLKQRLISARKILSYIVKTLHINFYQNWSSIVEVLMKNTLVFFMPHSV